MSGGDRAAEVGIASGSAVAGDVPAGCLWRGKAQIGGVATPCCVVLPGPLDEDSTAYLMARGVAKGRQACGEGMSTAEQALVTGNDAAIEMPPVAYVWEPPRGFGWKPCAWAAVEGDEAAAVFSAWGRDLQQWSLGPLFSPQAAGDAPRISAAELADVRRLWAEVRAAVEAGKLPDVVTTARIVVRAPSMLAEIERLQQNCADVRRLTRREIAGRFSHTLKSENFGELVALAAEMEEPDAPALPGDPLTFAGAVEAVSLLAYGVRERMTGNQIRGLADSLGDLLTSIANEVTEDAREPLAFAVSRKLSAHAGDKPGEVNAAAIPTPRPLFMFWENDCEEWVIAHDEADASTVYLAAELTPPDGGCTWQRLPADKLIKKFHDEDEREGFVEKTCAAWCAELGRCYFGGAPKW